MEEEIYIKDIILKLWQGKYIIIGFTIAAILISLLISLFLTIPIYEARAYVDFTTYYEVQSYDLLQFVEIDNIKKTQRVNVSKKEHKLTGKFALLDSHPGIEIRVIAPEPEVAASEANLIGKALLEIAANNHINLLTEKKKEYERWSVFFEKMVAEMYGQEAERRADIELLADPIYLSLMEEKGSRIVLYQNILFELNELESTSGIHSLNIFKPATVPNQPINMRWKFNAVIAGALGLIISVLFVLIFPYVKSIYSNQKV